MVNRVCPHCGKLKAVAYARISDDQKGERLGVTDQIEDCWVRIGDEGWCTCTPELDTFQDNDIGASKGKHRPGWEGCLTAIRAGSYGALVARDDGRFTRRVAEFLPLIDLVTKQKMEVVTLWTERWDLTTAAGRKRVRDSASDAQYEAERTGERVSRSRLRDAKKGKSAPGGQKAWGFQPNRVDHNLVEVAAIRDCAKRILAEESIRSVALRYGKDPKTIKRVLTSPRMVAQREYKGNLYPAVWKPILDGDTYEGVKSILNARNRDRIGGCAARKYLLTGFLVCGACGLRCFAFKREQKKYIAYCCHPGGCVVRKMETVDDYVRDELLARVEVSVSPPTVDPALSAAVTGYVARLKSAKELWKTGVLGDQEYAADKIDLEARLLDARTRLAEATPEPVGKSHQIGDELLIGEIGQRRAWWEAADLRQRRVLIERHIQKVIINKIAPTPKLPTSGVLVTEKLRPIQIIGIDGKPW